MASSVDRLWKVDRLIDEALEHLVWCCAKEDDGPAHDAQRALEKALRVVRAERRNQKPLRNCDALSVNKAIAEFEMLHDGPEPYKTEDWIRGIREAIRWIYKRRAERG